MRLWLRPGSTVLPQPAAKRQYTALQKRCGDQPTMSGLLTPTVHRHGIRLTSKFTDTGRVDVAGDEILTQRFSWTLDLGVHLHFCAAVGLPAYSGNTYWWFIRPHLTKTGGHWSDLVAG
jgi:hypothetical protein